MEERGWNQVDFVYVSGDAYVDHPSFGHAIITRLLEAHGFRVGIIAQPDWKDKESITEFGEPRLGFMVSAGNMDSMVNHYSVSKKRRQQDSYTPGGVMGKRPDYAAVVYGNLIRQTYKKTPIILGGIEASLRRLAHYDYWSNQLSVPFFWIRVQTWFLMEWANARSLRLQRHWMPDWISRTLPISMEQSARSRIWTVCMMQRFWNRMKR